VSFPSLQPLSPRDRAFSHDEVDELRHTIALLRRALTLSIQKGQPVDKAELLNLTTEVALRYRCHYTDEAEADFPTVLLPKRFDSAVPVYAGFGFSMACHCTHVVHTSNDKFCNLCGGVV
jgi:hypothetical protein